MTAGAQAVAQDSLVCPPRPRHSDGAHGGYDEFRGVRMRRPFRRPTAAFLLLPALLVAPAAPAAASDHLPATYSLIGDPQGSQYEGIAVAPDRETFYVSEVTGGEIHRGEADERRTTVWLDEKAALADGRRTAVGLATDSRGRVYVAGGDNRTQAG